MDLFGLTWINALRLIKRKTLECIYIAITNNIMLCMVFIHIFLPNICYRFYNPYYIKNVLHQYKVNIPALTAFLVGGCNSI